MRLSFDTNNTTSTPPFHSVVWSLFCFSGLFHSTAGPPRVLYLAKRVTTSRYPTRQKAPAVEWVCNGGAGLPIDFGGGVARAVYLLVSQFVLQDFLRRRIFWLVFF